MVEADIIAFAVMAILLVYVLGSILPQRRPEEFWAENIEESGRPISTV